VALAAALPRAVVAKATTESRLVVVILRGAMDGLAAVPPHGDRDYRGLRGDLAIGAPGKSDGAIDLDGFFGLHPARAAPLHDVYAQRQLAVVHAVATPYRDRSHFDGQDLLENGTPTPHAVHDGWLNRALGLIGGSQTLGLSVGQSVPLMLRGQAAVTSWSPVKLPEVSPEFLDKVADLYRNDPVFAPALALGLGDQALVDKVSDAPGMESGGLKMNMLKRGSGLVKTVTTTVGKLLADPAGPRVAVIDVPGWDTHANQGTTNGRLAPVLAGLAEGLVSLQQAMAPVWSKTVVLTLTEFGRTAHPNGTGGTDHGTATAAFVMGGAVNGGRVIADWPGLSNARLYQSRDLAPTTDTRALCKAILRNHLGLPQDAIDRVVFPESTAVRPLEDLVVA
jgi:uncharacterized protein (DUF1501 family)